MVGQSAAMTVVLSDLPMAAPWAPLSEMLASL